MGDISLVQLNRLRHPLAPGTVAFSVAATDSCEHKHHQRNPWNLLRYTGIAQGDGKVLAQTGRLRTYKWVWDNYTLFKVEPRAITELKETDELAAGDFIAGFVFPCSRALPFMLTSPGWLTAEGIKAYRTDLAPFGTRLCFTPNPAGWLLVEAGWNLPLNPSQLTLRQEVDLYTYDEGKTGPRTVSSLDDGYVGFAYGWSGVHVEELGVSRWLFNHVLIPRIVR